MRIYRNTLKNQTLTIKMLSYWQKTFALQKGDLDNETTECLD